MDKFKKLNEYLEELGSAAIAFSGGVDSTLLLKAAHDVLGDNCIAITARSCTFPERELKEAQEFCQREGIKHIIMDSEELEAEGFSKNPISRCYICKKALFTKMRRVASEYGINNIVEGSNMDDNTDYRPGLVATKEEGIKSPLMEAELSKKEIRELSGALGLSTSDKPSFACLSSRIPYGEEITREKLAMIEKAEQVLIDMGFRQVRVRMHGKLARIELLPCDFEKMLALREKTVYELKNLGFTYVSLDLSGYRSGSMNEGLENV